MRFKDIDNVEILTENNQITIETKVIPKEYKENNSSVKKTT